MAKIHLDRLKKKYGWTGSKYNALVSKIIMEQDIMISRRVAELHKNRLLVEGKKAAKRTGSNIEVPNVTDVLPKRSVFLRKAATRGELMMDALRDRLTSNLRKAVTEYLDKGKESMQYRQGERRGRIKPELVDDFEKVISSTFSDYVHRKPNTPYPSNIHTIAVTEVNSAISLIKHRYTERLLQVNKGKLFVKKTWRQHPELSKEPRPGHRSVDGKSVAMNEAFSIPVYQRIGTIKSGPNRGRPRWKRTGQYVQMQFPHDPNGPADEVIGCHCNVDYVVVAKKKKQENLE